MTIQRRRILTLIVFAALSIAGCSRTDNSPAASKGQSTEQGADVTFKTPEEAITHYLNGVAQNDVRKILQASAVNETGGKFSFAAYAERLRMINPSYLAPAEYPFYSEINRAQVASQILGQVKILSYGLLSGEKLEGTPFQVDAERANKFIKDVDPGRLSGLEVRKIAPPNKAVMGEARYAEISAAQAKSFGADETTERVALFSFEQNYYYVGFTLLRYGAGWKVAGQSSNLAGTSPLGMPQRTTEADFDSMIK